MNPATRKSPLDNAKFRENYLSNLRLQASNDQRNMNANVIFKQTGAPPPVLPDYRTMTEKYADLEGLKVQLRSKLSTITDANIASQIVGELSHDQIQFALNKWEVIDKDMKAKFALGVPAPVFIAYLNRLIDTITTIDNVEVGLQQNPYNFIPSMNQILYTFERGPLLQSMIVLLNDGADKFKVDMEELIQMIRFQSNFFNTKTEQAINSLNAEDKQEVLNMINQYIMPTLTSKGAITQLISQLQTAISRNDARFFSQVVDNIYTNFTMSDETDAIVREISKILSKAPRPERGIGGADFGGDQIPSPDELDAEDETDFFNKKQPESFKFEEATAPLKPTLSAPIGLISEEEFRQLTAPRQRDYINNELITKYPNIVVSFTKRSGGTREIGGKEPSSGRLRTAPPTGFIRAENIEIFQKFIAKIKEGGGGGGGGGGEEGEEKVKKRKKEKFIPPPQREGEEDDLYQARIYDELRKYEEGLSGKGLRKPRMKGRGLAPRGSIAHLTDAEYEKPKLYTQLGRYFINKPKLQSSILSLRTPSGGLVKDLQPQRISPSLHSVVTTLVGKGLPTYEQISKMSDEDRDKLIEICKTCHLEVPSIPKSKNMDKEEQDNYRFEVLRGELFAGNNSPTIVREFKSLLLKFINRGKVPRNEGKEILQNLVEMGL